MEISASESRRRMLMTTRMERMMKIRQDRLVEFVFCGGDGGEGGGYDCIDSLMAG